MDPTFSTIASKYDLMTRLMSFGLEQGWKTKAVDRIPKNTSPKRILDLATGTGDFPLHLRGAGFAAPIVALDRNPKMLAFSQQKCAGKPKIHLIQGDLTQIPLRDWSFDIITMGYGLRYVIDIRQVLREVYRLLHSGGTFVCLEFGVPKNPFYRRLCFGYLLLLGTLLGLVLHGKADTYWHIVESLKAYPGQETVAAWLNEAGFDKIGLREELGGIITILSATRP
jgi:demethylmenaquinone methyltransferase/2-methoxy-6-polyprenyl-1,4-benzoquinol methylase